MHADSGGPGGVAGSDFDGGDVAYAGRWAMRLLAVPGAIAVVLGGSRARSEHRADSDWDFGLYYRSSEQAIEPNAIVQLGVPGQVVAPGEWGRLMNGGAWLDDAGTKVDVLYRDLDAVENWWREAEAGRFEVDTLPGYLAGIPTYSVVAELAHNRLLAGALPPPLHAPVFPATLRVTAPVQWRFRARFALLYASGLAHAANVVACRGQLALAVLCEAHARTTSAGTWVLNEKRLITAAGLDVAHDVLAPAARDADSLAAMVDSVEDVLDLEAIKLR